MWLRSLAFLLLLYLPGSSQAADALPALKGQTLAGTKFDLGSDGKISTIVVMGFSKASVPRTIAWEDALWADFGGNTRVAIVSVAMLEKAPGFIRPMIVRSIRKKAPLERHSKFVIVTENTQAWMDHAGADLKADADRPFIFALMKNGLPGCHSALDFSPAELKRLKDCWAPRMADAR